MAPVQRQGRDKARAPPATKPRETSEVSLRALDPARCFLKMDALSPDELSIARNARSGRTKRKRNWSGNAKNGASVPLRSR
jgi:hypothetical protein